MEQANSTAKEHVELLSSVRHQFICGLDHTQEAFLRLRVDVTAENKLERIFIVKNRIDDLLIENSLGYVSDMDHGFNVTLPKVEAKDTTEFAISIVMRVTDHDSAVTQVIELLQECPFLVGNYSFQFPESRASIQVIAPAMHRATQTFPQDPVPSPEVLKGLGELIPYKHGIISKLIKETPMEDM